MRMGDVDAVSEIHVCNSVAFGDGMLGNERQEMVNKLKVAVVGTNLLGQMVLASLYGLGVRNIYYFDNSRSVTSKDKGFLYGKREKIAGKKQSDMVFEALHQIDHTPPTIKRHGRFAEAFIMGFNPDILIDATNEVVSKEKVLRYAFRRKNNPIPVISLSSDEDRSAIACYWPKNKGRVNVLKENPDLDALVHEEFNGKDQGGFTSGIVSGIAVEEVRKYAFKYNDDDAHLPSNHRLIYNLYSKNRKGLKSNLRKNNLPTYRKNNVLVVGAGALGNWASIYLRYLGIGRIDFVDYDVAEHKNLNRQTELRNFIGHNKAEVLSMRVRNIDHKIKSDVYNGKLGDVLSREDKRENIKLISEKELTKKQYDVVLGCVDNKHARIWMNTFTKKHNVPYIDGGTHPKAGQVAVYIPGVTSSIGDQLDLEGFPEGGNICDGPNPSVVMSNEIIAAAMVGEMIHVLDYNSMKNVIDGPMSYATELPQRIYVERNARR